MSANITEQPAAAAPAESPAPVTVESITEGVKNTSVAPKVENPEADAAQAASAAEGRRLYIGNLAYSTTDEQLKEFFTGFSMYVPLLHPHSHVRELTCHVCSESTTIPTHPRTGRAVGYAFVDLHTQEEAQRAIAELSGKEVVERKVSVQLARKVGSQSPKKEGEEGASSEEQQPKKGRTTTRSRKTRGRGPKVSTIAHFTSASRF